MAECPRLPGRAVAWALAGVVGVRVQALGASGLGLGLPPLPAACAGGGVLGGGLPPLNLGGGAAPPSLPTLNLLGGFVGLGGGGGAGTPSDVQQMQARAVQDASVDGVCPGKTRQTVDVGQACWAAIWKAGGCQAENVPAYEPWHQAQSLEVLVADVVQWANLPDGRHKSGCYGTNGPPINEDPPAQAPGVGMLGGSSPLGGGMLGGGSPLGGGGLLGGGGSFGGLSGGGPLGGGLGAPQAQGPPPPPEVVRKIESALQSSADVCPGASRQATGVGPECWSRIWAHVGCLVETTPPYEEWHSGQSFEVLIADAAQWASLPSERHQTACYGLDAAARSEL